MRQITEPQWELIVERVDNGFCVPFLGAAVNVSSGTYKGLPLGGQVALAILKKLLGLTDAQIKKLADLSIHPLGGQVAICELKKLLGLTKAQAEKLADIEIQGKIEGNKYYKDIARISLYNLSRIALHYELATDSPGLDTLIKSLIADDKCQPSSLLKTLAELPFRLIVTTNYDRLLERALDAAGRDYKVVVQPVKGFTPAEQKKIRQELAAYSGLVVYKIHGSFDELSAGPKASSRWVTGASQRPLITEEDYIEFLTVVAIEEKGVPKLISEKIVDSTLLFLGYSLEDWDFRTIFKGLVETLPSRAQRRSYAIQKGPSEFWVEFWDKKRVTIIEMDLYDFGSELGKRYLAYKKV